jgi:hypothetical protein
LIASIRESKELAPIADQLENFALSMLRPSSEMVKVLARALGMSGSDQTGRPLSSQIPFATGGRLSFSESAPAPATFGSASFIFLLPFNGDRKSLYNAAEAVWRNHKISGTISVQLPSASMGQAFDVFCYASAGRLRLELSQWTSPTARKHEIERFNGLWVKEGDASRLLAGAVLTSSVTAGLSYDKYDKRHLANVFNRLPRPLKRAGTGSSLHTGGWQQAGGDADNKVSIMNAVKEEGLQLALHTTGGADSAGWATGIGINRTDGSDADATNMPAAVSNFFVAAVVEEQPRVGSSIYYWNENGTTNGADFGAGLLTGLWKC